MNLNSDITFLNGVGPKKALLLNKELGVFTFEDLLYYFPYKYIDRTQFYALNQISAQMPYIQAKGKIIGFKTIGEGAKKRLIGKFTDGTAFIDLIWFKQVNRIADTYKIGTEYIVFGKPTTFNHDINIVHPELEAVESRNTKVSSSLDALYNTTDKMKKGYLNSKALQKLQKTMLKLAYSKLSETLPDYLIKHYDLIHINQTLLNIHFPQSNELLSKAQFRLKFEELFFIQLRLLRKKINLENTTPGFVFNKVGSYFNDFYTNNLPFELTNAQKRVLREIRKDCGSGKQMNRLLQGDVGSGKTMVALMTMLLALDNNFQACMMAPTEILANQHLVAIQEFLEGIDIKVGLLTGSTKKKARRILHEQLEDGSMQILIGTHALIEDVVKFKNLGIVIIDEQHRFGVAQRARLWKKNTSPPHILVMTATPIPRTLSMTLYGDLEVSAIDELPPGRKPVRTLHQYDKQRLKVFAFMRKQIEEGRQVYIVYPLIQESETMDYKDLEDGYESICRAFPDPKYTVSVVHGKMKPPEKDKAMQLFVKGQAQIMVATTVIEVGVNVPNASVMIIESAERFGLSQLHQLRGRVGRGADQSYCILMTSYKLSADGRKRIETMVKTTDGFEIAEVDMQLRGPGDIEGTQQSGVPINLKIANLTTDGKILEIARDAAKRILTADRNLIKAENAVLLHQINKTEKKQLNWREIS